MWYSAMKQGNVNRATVGQKSATFGGGGTLSVQILLHYDFYVGSVEVEYLVDSAPPVVTVGSGTPAKSITDTQYEIVSNSSTTSLSGGSGSMFSGTNVGSVDTRMRARALAELAKANIPPISGNLTVIGDETIDLRSSVSIKGQLLEVSHVSHSFQNGYITTISLTNEPFVKTIVFQPIIYGASKSTDTERHSKSMFYDVRSDTYMKLKKELASQKDTTDKQASASGKYAIYQD